MSAAERVLVLAPVGRDAAVLADVVARAGHDPLCCADVDGLVRALGEGAGAVLLTEHALGPAAVPRLVGALAAQPAWSDVPLVLLAGAAPGPRAAAVAALRRAGNLTVIVRPTRGPYLATVIQAAIRARRRQYEVRDLVGRERAARAEAEEARAEAEVAARAKDDFLATVSHELRTPLSAVLLWSRMLDGGQLTEAQARRAVETIRQSAEAQSRLIEDLLDVSRMAAGEVRLDLADVDVAGLVGESLAVVTPAADAKQIRLEASVPDGAAVRGDPGRLQQVLVNVLSNAVKFTPPGGGVGLRAWRAGAQVVVEVADTGRGMAADALPRVFERFHQADAGAARRGGGLGLGLAISRHLVELHGGSIRAESAGPGRGSTFTIDLPAAPKADR